MMRATTPCRARLHTREEPMADTATIQDDAETRTDDEALVEEDLLVEDVSIDGMCGVY